MEIATLAGGCFWGVEELFRTIPGVIDTEVGYSGGHLENPTYQHVKTGSTGHAEAIQIKFDPSTVTYAALLEFFFKIHDPTTEDRQGNDIGTQYRSAIFYHSDQQKQTAIQMIDRINQSGVWKKPIVTAVDPFTKFTKAEDYHQDYLQKNPNGYTCHYERKLQF